MARASVWISVSRASTSLLTMLSTIVLARLLVPADFGLVALATTMLAVLTAITETSMASALIHLKNPTDDHYHTAWTLGAVRGVLLALGLAGIAAPVADLYDAPRLETVMYALTISILLTGVANPRLIMLQKQLVFRQVFYVNLAQSVMTVLVSVTLALIYRSYWALVFGAIAGQAANVIVSYALFPFRPRLGFRHFRELWSFSIWLSLGQVVATVNLRFDHLLIGGWLGRAVLGYYSVGSNLAVVPSREAVVPLTQTLFPAYSLVSDDTARLRRAYQRTLATVTAIALPAGIGFALIADPLVRLAMGEKWAPAIAVVQVVGSLYALQTLQRLANPLAMAKGATQLIFNRALQMFLIRLPLVAVGMYYWGLPGLLLGRVVAGLAGIFINLHMVRSLIGLPMLAQLRSNNRCFAAALAMIGAVTAVQSLLPQGASAAALAQAILLPVLVGAAAYAGAMLLLWLAQGRPSGPETEAAELAGRLVGRLRARSGAARSG